jgi:methylenetetrahydrofolate dehydrogenase (NADP+)/methenyltetrahydrofolate cyclohydrolase
MIKSHAGVIDAGTSDVNGTIVGDIADEVRDLDDISITPKVGGVGPLTIAALIDNVIRAARIVANKEGQKDLG